MSLLCVFSSLFSFNFIWILKFFFAVGRFTFFFAPWKNMIKRVKCLEQRAPNALIHNCILWDWIRIKHLVRRASTSPPPHYGLVSTCIWAADGDGEWRLLRKRCKGVSQQLLQSFIRSHYELSCNEELMFFDDLCIPVKIKVCLKAELKRTEVGTY